MTEYEMLSILAEELNMRKAAERLYVTQPALSQRLRTIEREWGTQIFLRSKRGLALTPAGEKIIAYVNRMIREQEKVRDEISFLKAEVSGTLKLAAASIIGQYWLPKFLKQYVERYPNVKISLITGWSSEILHQFDEEHFHIGIIRGNPEWKGMKKRLLTDELVLVDTTIQSISALKSTDKPFIQFKSDSTYYREIQSWWHEHFISPPERTIVVDQIETCKQMALNGIGYAILPSISLTENDRDIYKIPLMTKRKERVSRDTWIISHESYTRLKQVEAFLNLVSEMEK
ncbi:LysR family transcriptional regulator [Pueribacillus theae]|uniref:LysR family transcriptional regulator n=1 Tax=Pueribacillus theae TaxID=2171751 RepID=A0A2U1K7V7_9BACI|nr:LysR family transcriptional regulator [Pueribacillus theae]PWA13355.1 LysR family transcriptional regulator [Pueribacillus theae]